jgi:hypothetical protein
MRLYERTSEPFLWIAVALAAILLLSCGDSSPSEPPPPPDPIPGWLRIRLDTQNTDDGGIMFSVTGGQVDSIRSAYSDLFTSSGSPAARRAIVAGDLTSGGIIAEILVPDVQKVADYTATVEQVAARESFVQRAASSVSLTVER